MYVDYIPVQNLVRIEKPAYGEGEFEVKKQVIYLTPLDILEMNAKINKAFE